MVGIVAKSEADVLLLQDVDAVQQWKAELEKLGYSVLYAKGRGATTGIATAYKTDKFDLITNEVISFDTIHARLRVPEAEAHLAGMLSLLYHKVSQKKVIFGNTHFHSSNGLDHVKYAQAALLFTKIE